MRPIKAAVVSIVALAALAGCTAPGAAPGSQPPSVDPDEEAVATIAWQGGTEEPKLELTPPLRVSQATVGVVEPGTGATISLGQLVTFDALVVDGETGDVESSTFGGEDPEQLILSPATADVTMLAALRSARVGARFLYVVPAPLAEATEGGGAQPSKVIGISVRSVADLPAQASGRALTPDPTLPEVRFSADGTPSLSPVDGEPGEELRVTELIEGTGPVVAQGQTLAVKYHNWLWDGTRVSAAWGDGPPLVLNLDEVISGWNKAIVGRKVGSRVLMVVPPALAYGGAGQEQIPPGATLVFLVDILAAY